MRMKHSFVSEGGLRSNLSAVRRGQEELCLATIKISGFASIPVLLEIEIPTANFRNEANKADDSFVCRELAARDCRTKPVHQKRKREVRHFFRPEVIGQMNKCEGLRTCKDLRVVARKTAKD
jgi:hypothetical protein